MLQGTFLGAGRRGDGQSECLGVGVPDVSHRVVQHLGQPMAALQAPHRIPVLVTGSTSPWRRQVCQVQPQSLSVVVALSSPVLVTSCGPSPPGSSLLTPSMRRKTALS